MINTNITPRFPHIHVQGIEKGLFLGCALLCQGVLARSTHFGQAFGACHTHGSCGAFHWH